VLDVRSAPMAVVPGRLAVARMQTFAEVWWQLLKCLLRVDFRQTGEYPYIVHWHGPMSEGEPSLDGCQGARCHNQHT
jgi:hypothetical protein